MGPLFSTVVVVIGFAFVVGTVFFVLRLFQPGRKASAVALGFGIGAILGAGVAAIGATLVAGVESTLHSGVAVAAYLGFLCLGGLIGGGFGARQALRVLTRRSSGLPSASAELQR